MKLTFLIFLLVGVTSNYLFGQEQENINIRYGLGASVFNLPEYLYEFQSVNSIYLTMDMKDNFRLEPTIGFALSKGLKKYIIGVGLFKQKPISNFSLLYGLRIGFGNDKLYFVAPAIGGEYFIIKKFSIGSEIQLRGSIHRGEFTLLTNSSLLVRFYF
jgi:hypothetical protein